MMKIYLFVCFCSCLLTVFCEDEEPCTTVDGGEGNCISVFECQPYLQMTALTKPELFKILRKAQCGFEGRNPKVCCPHARTTHANIISFPPSAPSLPTTTAPVPIIFSRADSEDLVPSLPKPPHCGASNKSSILKIIGGDNAQLGDFPWMALLVYRKPLMACGGSLISSKHVLTAAHCIHNLENVLYAVRLGELDLSKDDDGARPIDVPIKKMIEHEDYVHTYITNDIAILVLEKEVQFTDLIKPICIPLEHKLRARSFESDYPFVGGWGEIKFGGPAASHLQVVQLPVVSNEFCARAYRKFKLHVIDERKLCAGYKKGGKDQCKGDSGAPLMDEIWNKTLSHYYQIGVASYGRGCAEPGFPGVYTRVTHFVPWIMRTVVGDAA